MHFAPPFFDLQIYRTAKNIIRAIIKNAIIFFMYMLLYFFFGFIQRYPIKATIKRTAVRPGTKASPGAPVSIRVPS